MVLVATNLGLFVDWGAGQDLLIALQFDGAAIRHGEFWRILTANLVHFNVNHFVLDVGVFLVLGMMYERSFGRAFAWLLLVTALAGSLAGLAMWSERTICRGLSAVDSGLFAAALYVEFRLSLRDRLRLMWVVPAAAIFVVKNIYELATGQSFFGTESALGGGQLAVAAHTAAIVAALAICLTLTATARWPTAESNVFFSGARSRAAAPGH